MGARAANDRFGAQITHPSGCDERPVLELSIHFRMWIFVSTIIHRENIMIDPTALITYSLIVLGFIFISAPATLLTVGRATTSGAKVGIATGAGITAGNLLQTIMAVVGISAIIAASATLFTIVKYLGAAYLVYLGLRAILKKASVNLEQGRVPITAPQAFRQAILA